MDDAMPGIPIAKNPLPSLSSLKSLSPLGSGNILVPEARREDR